MEATVNMSLKCPKCGKTFISKSVFQNHLQDQHGMTQQEIKALFYHPDM